MENLYLLLSYVQRYSHIPIHCYDSAGMLCIFRQTDDGTADPFLCDLTLKDRFLFVRSPTPSFTYEQELILYSFFQDERKNTYILGPVRKGEMSDEQLSTYCEHHKMGNKTYSPVFRPLEDFITFTGMIYYLATNKALSEEELIHAANKELMEFYEWQNQSQTKQPIDEPFERLPFQTEQQLFAFVRDGNIKAVKDRFRTTQLWDKLPKTTQNKFKQFEYMICASITLTTRAAIAGGLAPDTAYRLSDMYLRSLEKSTTLGELLLLQHEMTIVFTENVRRVRDQDEALHLVTQCKNYIENHLTRHFTLEDLAQALFVSKWHLSHTFSSEEGICLHDYILLRRINAAKNMLRFSDTPISEIASNYCFSSQSHFTKTFRKLTGTTPLRYRKYNISPSALI